MGFFRRTSAGHRATAIPRGYRVYAVGDVHGRRDLLDRMLENIEEDIAGRAKATNLLVFLGDLIDRGPASREVIERVRTYRHPDIRVVALVGNHEEVLLRLLRGDGEHLYQWLRFGGAECAKSYGLDPVRLKRMDEKRAIAELQKAIPPEHSAFLERLSDTVEVGKYLFVHAGLRPGVALREQDQTDLRWIREPFLESEVDHGVIVVHGHTISSEIDIRVNRIGLDTGAYRTGVLSAVALEGDERWFLSSSCGNGREPTTSGMVAS